jgi:hypothetical protein
VTLFLCGFYAGRIFMAGQEKDGFSCPKFCQQSLAGYAARRRIKPGREKGLSGWDPV